MSKMENSNKEFINFKKKIDEISDKKRISSEKAFILMFLKMKYPILEEKDLIKFITDGANDRGIDAYYIIDSDKTIYLIQSKYSARNTYSNLNEAIGSFENISKKFKEPEEALNYLKNGNDKIKHMLSRIRRKILTQEYEVKFDFITTHKVSNKTKNTFKSININDFDKIMELYNEYLRGWTPPLGKIELKFENKNKILNHNVDENIKTIVLACKLSQLKEMIETTVEKGNIFNKNIRLYIKKGNTTPVNGIKRTIKKEPKNFWLYHNGVTIVCSNYKKCNNKIIIQNPQIVNGGQTAETLRRLEDMPNLEEAHILVKIITTSKPNLISKITEATNTQIAVNISDIKSNDPRLFDIHCRLKEERYFIERKRGEWDRFKIYNNTSNFKKITSSKFAQIIFSFYYNRPDISKNYKKRLFEEKNFEKIFSTKRSKYEYIVPLEIYSIIKNIKSEYYKKRYWKFKKGSTFISNIEFLLLSLIGNKIKKERLDYRSVAIGLKERKNYACIYKKIKEINKIIYLAWKHYLKKDENIAIQNFVKEKDVVAKVEKFGGKELRQKLKEIIYCLKH